MSFLQVHMGSRLPTLIAHSPLGRAAGFCGPPEACPLGHTDNLPLAQRAHLLCSTYTCINKELVYFYNTPQSTTGITVIFMTLCSALVRTHKYRHNCRLRMWCKFVSSYLTILVWTPSPQLSFRSKLLNFHTLQGSATQTYCPQSLRQGTTSYTWHIQTSLLWSCTGNVLFNINTCKHNFMCPKALRTLIYLIETALKYNSILL